MKKIILCLLLTVSLGCVAEAQSYDTISGRPPHAYLDFWFDTAPWYLNNTVDYCFRLSYNIYYYRGSNYRLQIERQKAYDPIRVVGLGCMVAMDSTTNCDHQAFAVRDHTPTKDPQYLYLYKDNSLNNPLLDSSGFYMDTVELLAKVRWDTATPKVYFSQHRSDPSYGRDSCWIYEVMLDSAIDLESYYLIGGTFPQDYDRSLGTTTSSVSPIHYYGIQAPFPMRVFDCDPSGPFYYLQDSTGRIHSRGWPSVFWLRNDSITPARIYDDYFGLTYGCMFDQRYAFGRFFPIIESLHLTTTSEDESMGMALGGGYYSDSTYKTIRVWPRPGYAFSHWNDGDTHYRRSIFLTQDTAFTAHFRGLDTLILTTVAQPAEGGTVIGGGIQFEGYNRLQALPAENYVFDHWDNGSNNPSRTIHQIGDTTVTAYFHKLDSFVLKMELIPPEGGSFRFSTPLIAHETQFRQIDSSSALVIEGGMVDIEIEPGRNYLIDRWSDLDTGFTFYTRTTTITSDTLISCYLKKTDNDAIELTPYDSRLTLTPNPAHDKVLVTCPENMPLNDAWLHIYDAAGKKLHSEAMKLSTHTISLSKIPAGMYFITVTTPGHSAYEKLIVE